MYLISEHFFKKVHDFEMKFAVPTIVMSYCLNFGT